MKKKSRLILIIILVFTLTSCTGIGIDDTEYPKEGVWVCNLGDKNLTVEFFENGKATFFKNADLSEEIIEVNYGYLAYGISFYPYDDIHVPLDGTWEFGENKETMIISFRNGNVYIELTYHLKKS